MPACSRDRCGRVVGVLALALLLPGCFTGHLLAAARRREYAREIQTVTHGQSGTVVRYTAEVTDDDGASRGMVERTARVEGDGPEPTLRQLTRTRTEAWVYPLIPLALAVDVVLIPTLVLMSPAILVFGD